MKRFKNNWSMLHEPVLKQMQARRLHRYLKDVVLPFSAYYRELFRKHGITPDSFHTLDDLRRLPFTSKEDLLNSPEHPKRARDFVIIPDEAQVAHRPSVILHALLRGRDRAKLKVEREFRPIMMTSTTGRSSDPVPFLYTAWDLRNLAEAGRRTMEVCGASRDFRLLNMFPYAPHLAFWQTHYAAMEFGVFCVGTGGGKVLGTRGNVRLMDKIDPDVIIGMPTFVYHVLQQANEAGIRCGKLRRIVLGGEKAPAGIRRKLCRLARDLGATEVDVAATYGFTEAKMAWGECPAPAGESTTGYHLYPDLGIIEIIDPESGEVLGPGEPGEIVYTPLSARGSVVIRYRTGDTVDGGLVYEACPRCGRRVPRLTGRISRVSNFQELNLDKIKGTLVNFNELEHAMDDVESIGSWLIELRKQNDDPLELDELIVHVEKNGQLPEEQLERELTASLSAATELRPNRIVFETAEEMRRLQGVGVELKEKKVIDNRPGAGESEPAVPAREPANA